MIEPTAPAPNRDPEPSLASAPSPSLNRTAIAADLDAMMNLAKTHAMWPLVDLLVRRLTGRSLTQRSSDISWAVMNLPDDQLELILAGFLERTAGYLGLAPAAPPPAGPERAAIGALVRLRASAP